MNFSEGGGGGGAMGTSSVENDLSPSRLDLRVGKIVSVAKVGTSIVNSVDLITAVSGEQR